MSNMGDSQNERSGQLSHEEVVEAFRYSVSAQRLLSKERSRERLIETMLNDSSWLQSTLSTYIERLRIAAKQNRSLAEAMNKLIEEVNKKACTEVRAENEKLFLQALNALRVISPRTSDSPSWHNFFELLTKEKAHYHNFIKRYWSIRDALLNIAIEVLSPDDVENNALVMPLLDVEPSEFGRLISVPSSGRRVFEDGKKGLLRLPVEWNYLATEKFIDTTFVRRSLPDETLQHFEQYHEQLLQLFDEISGLRRRQNKWQILTQFFVMLSGYWDIDTESLLFLLFKANPPEQEADDLLTAANLDEKGKHKFFQEYELLCIKRFFTSPLMRSITLYSLPAFPLTWDRMSSLVTVFEKPEMTEIERFAEALNACIKSPIQLGMLLSLLVRLAPERTDTLLSKMAKCARRDINKVVYSESSGDDMQALKARFFAYVQFALSLSIDNTYDAGPGVVRSELINHLLDEAVFDFISTDAEHWPANLRTQWERKKSEYSLSHQQEMRLSSVVEARTTPLASSTPSVTDVTRSQVPLTQSPEVYTVLHKEENRILKKLKRVLEKGGAGRLAVFWLENYVVLEAIAPEKIGQDNMQRMQIAYDFYEACKRERSSEKSLEVENAIVEAYQQSHNSGDLVSFTPGERRRCERARKWKMSPGPA